MWSWKQILLGLALIVASCGDADAPSFASFELDLTRSTLTNGLEVAIARDRDALNVTALIAVRSGAFVESPEQSGFSHLLEHMIFQGSPQLPDERAFKDELNRLGAQCNATTGRFDVMYFCSAPLDNLSNVVELLASALRDPILDGDALDQEKRVVLSELDLRDSFWSTHQWQRANELLFDPYANRTDPSGTRESVEAATPDALRELHDTYYRPNNALLVLSGNVDPQTGSSLAKQFFGDWSTSPDPFRDHPVPAMLQLKASAEAYIIAPIHKLDLQFAYRGPGTLDDPRGAVAAAVLSQITNQSTQAFRELIKAPIVGAGLSYEAAPHDGVIRLSLSANEGGLTATIMRLQVLYGFAGTIQDDAVEAAKNFLWTDQLLTADDNLRLAQNMGDDWALGFARGAPERQTSQFLSLLSSINRADVVRVINRYLKGKPRVAVLMSPTADDEHKLSGVRPAW